MILTLIKMRRSTKVLALTLLFSFGFQIVMPGVAYALTGGPSQPEVESFEPVSTTQMVDLFSGDFNYNIPLLEVDGYPINISYHSGVTMDQEASWVGLGWNINPGVINRNMRGLPDDFKGDKIVKELSMKPNNTYGLVASLGTEFFGKEKLSGMSLGVTAGLGINYNNYNGVGFERVANLSFSSAKGAKGKSTAGLGLRSSANDGLTVSPSFSYTQKINTAELGGTRANGFGVSMNSRTGLKEINFSTSSNIGRKVNHEEKQNSGEYSGGAGISFGMTTHTPLSEFPFENYSANVSVKGGADFLGSDVFGVVQGYFSRQTLSANNVTKPAFGYFNSESAVNNLDVLLDFNREKEVGFNDNTPALPVTNYTYDVYSVAGQGVGGVFRPFRGDIGTVSAPSSYSTSISMSLGGEVGVGQTVKGGVDITVNDVYSESGLWITDNDAYPNLKSKQKYLINDGANLEYENFYFKQAGEFSVDDEPEYYERHGKNIPVRVKLSKGRGNDIYASSNYVTKHGKVLPIEADKNYRKKRVKRNQMIAMLSIKEASILGLQNNLYTHSTSPNKVYVTGQNSHHIGELTTLREDGYRYIYGIPAYNTYQEEVAFNVGRSGTRVAESPDCETGLVSYDDEDNKLYGNEHGLSHFYSRTIVPGYAHSYLLTAVVSPDYADVDDTVGPSAGDYGTYTLFNYYKNDTYKWRVPYQGNKANYNEMLKSDDRDDQANYIYGEKELWYLSSIVTRNYVAVFYTSDRFDGYEVAGRNGGPGTKTTKKLDKIALFAKHEYALDPSNAVPLKTVHFEYDYSLCDNIDNNPYGGGKLTLQKLYFTYGKSFKGKLSAYEFDYNESDPDYNPDYNLKGYDRWGNYKPNSVNNCNASTINNIDYPYVGKDSALQSVYSSVWTLREIKLPSGAKMKIEYEADDYAYVQDRRAMEMFTIQKISKDQPSDGMSLVSGNKLFENNIQGTEENYYLLFKLKKNYANDISGIDETIKQDYLEGISDLYFRFLVNIGPDGSGNYEFVSGYAELDQGVSYGAIKSNPSGDYDYGWVKLKSVPIGDRDGAKDVHPISKAAWQFGRINAPRIVWSNEQLSDPSDGESVLNVLKRISSSNILRNLVQLFRGPNRTLMSRGCGKEVITQKSYIRLNSPDYKKLGGGSRVKKISIMDAWSEMLGSSNPALTSEYGQIYTYTTFDPVRNEEISSGVATYEPAVGADENPFKLPVPYGNTKRNYLAPDDYYYLDEPFGESFFPAPSVGYSRVTVRNIPVTGLNKHSDGYTENLFYTAKDFPIITDRTTLDALPKRSNMFAQLFKVNTKDYMTASQGFLVELNDMHGKIKAVNNFASGQVAAISGTSYHYKIKSGDHPKTNQEKLDNFVNTIDQYGNIQRREVGVDFEIINDFSEQQTTALSTGLGSNVAAFFVAIFPAIVPSVLPKYGREHTRFRSAVTTKVVNRYALLDFVETFDQGARVVSKNLAYDAVTGKVLLTETTNQYDDRVYNITYPAHWAYDNMGPAYKNIGLELIGTLTNATFFSQGVSESRFVPGDELLVSSMYSSLIKHKKAWVYSVQQEAVSLIDEKGDAFDLNLSIYSPKIVKVKIVRSGRRNQQANTISTLTLLRNPLDLNNDGIIDSKMQALDENYQILDAQAIEFSDEWNTYCGCDFGSDDIITEYTKNPYLNGMKGNWKPRKAYSYLSNRMYSNKNFNTNTRRDGTYTEFSSFWNSPVSAPNTWTMNNNGWVYTSEVTVSTPNGFELENKDALGRYSSALNGYNYNVPVAVSSNARYKEIAYDGFEDYDFTSVCRDDHFSYRPHQANISTNEAHTGKKSIKVNYNSAIEVQRKLNTCNP